MIEILFLPNINNDNDSIINKENLHLFNTDLNILKCNTKFKDIYLNNSSKYCQLDNNIFYLNNENNIINPIEIFSSDKNNLIKIFGIGFIEIKKYYDYINNININFNESIEYIIKYLMNEFKKISYNSKEGFCFIIYLILNNNKYLFFGRDQQGNSSLIMSIGNYGKEIILSNILSELLYFKEYEESIEIPTNGFFLLNILNYEFKHFIWDEPLPYMINEFWNENKLISNNIFNDSIKLLNSLRSIFNNDIENRFTCININNNIFNYIGLLFSGGLDSTLLLYLLLEWLFINIDNIKNNIYNKFLINKKELNNKNDINIFFIIELINTTFNPTEAPDRITGLCSYYEILNLFKNELKKNNNISLRFICVDNDNINLIKNEIDILRCISPCRTHLDFNIGSALYFSLKGEGFLLDPNTFNKDWWNIMINNIDDLIIWKDVFEKKYLNNMNNNNLINNNIIIKCPYCKFKQHNKCLNKCCKSCCRKIQQKILKPECEVSYICTIHKMKNIDYSIIPSTERYIDTNNYYLNNNEYENILFDNELNLINNLIIKNNKKYYKIQSKYLIIGSGADEYLGGYGRHITAKKHNGFIGIKNEMLFDIKRLWIRNLGRDYRIALYNNKKLFPIFLQLSVIETIGNLNFENICISESNETKPLLRYIAKYLGIEFSSKFKKRAIQFGTRSSRQTNLKHFDSNRKATANTIYIPISNK